MIESGMMPAVLTSRTKWLNTHIQSLSHSALQSNKWHGSTFTWSKNKRPAVFSTAGMQIHDDFECLCVFLNDSLNQRKQWVKVASKQLWNSLKRQPARAADASFDVSHWNGIIKLCHCWLIARQQRLSSPSPQLLMSFKMKLQLTR